MKLKIINSIMINKETVSLSEGSENVEKFNRNDWQQISTNFRILNIEPDPPLVICFKCNRSIDDPELGNLKDHLNTDDHKSSSKIWHITQEYSSDRLMLPISQGELRQKEIEQKMKETL